MVSADQKMPVAITVLTIFRFIKNADTLNWRPVADIAPPLLQYANSAITFSPELNDSIVVQGVLNEGRTIQVVEFTTLKNQHILLCGVDMTETLTNREQSMSMTVSGDEVRRCLDESTVGVEDYLGPHSTSNNNILTTEPTTVPIEEAPLTSSAPVQVPINYGTERQAICIYFNEYILNNTPTYTLLKVDNRVYGPARRTVPLLIKLMSKREHRNLAFHPDWFEGIQYYDRAYWADTEHEWINERQKELEIALGKPASNESRVPVLYRGFEPSGEHIVVYQVAKNVGKTPKYVAIAFKRIQNKILYSTLKSSFIQAEATEFAKKLVENSLKGIQLPNLRTSTNTSLSSSSTPMPLRSSFQNPLSKSITSTLDSDWLKTEISLKLRLEYIPKLKNEPVELAVIGNLRPVEDTQKLANGDKIAFFPCKFKNDLEVTEYFVAVVDNLSTVANLRMLLGYHTTLAAAVTKTESFVRNYLFWATSDNGKLQNYAYGLDMKQIDGFFNNAIENGTFTRESYQEVKSQESISESSKTNGSHGWSWELFAGTNFSLDPDDESSQEIEILVFRFHCAGSRNLFGAVLKNSRFSMKQKRTFFSKKLNSSRSGGSSTSSKKEKIALSPFYFDVSHILNSSRNEFEVIYRKAGTDIVLVDDVELDSEKSSEIVSKIEFELAYLPYPTLSSHGHKINLLHSLPVLVPDSNLPIPLVCEISCGLDFGLKQYFTVILENFLENPSVRLIMGYHTTIVECVTDAIQFPTKYLHWRPVAGPLLDAAAEREIFEIISRSETRATKVQKRLKGSATDKALPDPQKPVLAASAVKLQESLATELPAWELVEKAELQQSNHLGSTIEALVYHHQELFVLVVANTTQGQKATPRVVRFFQGRNSCRNMTVLELIQEFSAGGIQEYSMIWTTEIIQTRWSASWFTFGGRDLERAVNRFFTSKMGRGSPTKRVLAWGLKGTLQSEWGDLFILYEVSWGKGPQYCIVELRQSITGALKANMEYIPLLFKSEVEAMDRALYYDDSSSIDNTKFVAN